MKNYSKKLQELKKEREEIFMEIFPFGKKNDDYTQFQSKDGVIQGIGGDMYRMGKSIITNIKSEPKSAIFHYEWKNSPLSWLIDCEFEGVLDLDLDNDLLKVFFGIWKKGVFKGEMFGFSKKNSFGVDENSDVQFGDSTIKPEFFSEYDKWKASPHSFYDGTIYSKSGGILGIKDTGNGVVDNDFNIISVVPGSKIIIKMQNGKINEVALLKRLDENSSDFYFKVKGYDDKDEIQSNVLWWEIRGNNHSEFLNNTVLGKSKIPLLFTKKFGLNFDSPIEEIIIIPYKKSYEDIKRSEKQKTPEELSKTQQYYDLSNAPFIGINKLGGEYYNERGVLVKNNVGRVYFNAPNSDVLNNFKNVVKNLNNKTLWSDFRQLKSWLDAKAINGAPENYLWLADLIGKDTTKRKIDDKNFLDSLNRIEAFLRYFVDIIVKYAGRAKRNKGQTDIPNNEIKELIKDNLRKYLGIDSQEEKKQNKTQQKNPKPQKKSRIIKENIVLSIKKTISNNLKQF